MIKACVIGWPISHSRSPLIHGYWLKQHGIDGSYTRQPVEPAALGAFLDGLSQRWLCRLQRHDSPQGKRLPPGDSPPMRRPSVWAPSTPSSCRDGKIFGTNTDGEGFINSLYQSAPGLSLSNARAVVLGAGGASLAVVNAILEQGASEVAVANRTIEKAELLRQRFGSRVVPVEWERMADQLSECSLLVNTTSLGMKGQPALELDLRGLHRRPS